MPALEATRGTYRITTDRERVDLDAVHAYLSRSYWAEGIPREVLARAVARSLCFSLLESNHQVGFARVVGDGATFAYLCDVYVLEAHRGRGLGKWLVATVQSHPDLQGLRRFVLVTRDAHGLYKPFGFTPLHDPARYMEVARPDVYRTATP